MPITYSARLRSPLASETERTLLERYAPLVRRAAHALSAMKPALLAQEDVLQDGMIGLLRAIRSTPSRDNEAQFAAYAGLNIRGAIIDGYRSAGEISRSEYEQAKKTRTALSAGQSVSHSARAHAKAVMTAAWSPTLPIEGNEEESLPPLQDPAPGPEQRAISNQLLRRAIDQLQKASVRNRSIFIACELQEEKHEIVARRYKITSGRVSQILKEVRQSILLALA